VLGGSRLEISTVECRKRQTSTATPAKPGDLHWTLEEYMSGDIADAQADFNHVTSWLTGVGFSSTRSPTSYQARDLAYYLFVQRATNLPSSIVSDVEVQLWSIQTANRLI